MCKQSSEDISLKKQDAYFIVMIELFCTIVIVSFVFFAKSSTASLAEQYHKYVIKPNDYTIFFPLSVEQMDEFDRRFFDPEKPESRGQQLQRWLADQLEVMNHYFVEITDPIKIARIDIVFDNKELIDTLDERGQAIKKNDKPRIVELEEKIDQQKNELYHARAVGVFVTFQTWQDVRYAKHTQRSKLQIFGEKV